MSCPIGSGLNLFQAAQLIWSESIVIFEAQLLPSKKDYLLLLLLDKEGPGEYSQFLELLAALLSCLPS